MVEYLQSNLLFFIIIAFCLIGIIVVLCILAYFGKQGKRYQDEEAAENGGAESANAEKADAEKQAKDKDVAPMPEDKAENTEQKSAYSGKWVITQMKECLKNGEEKESAFFFQLKASNGETLLTSEEYTSLRGATLGIETYKGNVARGNFKISSTKKGKYIVKLLTNQGALLAQGETYSTRSAAENGITSIKRFASSALRQEEVQVEKVPYEEVAPSEKSFDPTKKGKWVAHQIVDEESGEKSYYFELRASNGQLLFSSEDYSTLGGLKNGINTHKSNIAGGNVRVSITRNGDYIFKIFTANNLLLSIGEHYPTKALCASAVESVKRFASDADFVLEENE